MKLLSLLLIAFLFLQVFVEAASVSEATVKSLAQDHAGGDVTGLLRKVHRGKINCNYACARRCKKSSRKNVCHRACKTCCARCHCVPPGTYGNKNLCPCYARQRTHGNQPKCP